MATTSIGSDRQQGSALERYTDATILRDDKKLYFGNDGDVSLEYDEDGNNVLLTAGADIRISDTQQLQFGDGGDVTVAWDGSTVALGGTWDLSGADIKLSDTQQLQFGDGSDVYMYLDALSDVLVIKGLPTSDPGVSDALYLTNGSDLTLSAG